MNPKILGAFFAASMIAFSGAALAHGGSNEPALPPINTISFDPNLCIVYFSTPDGGSGAVQGTKGRVMVKFDFSHTFTVQANCTVTEFGGEFQDLPNKEGFDCFVQLKKAGLHWHQVILGGGMDVTNKLRFKNGKATMSCKGPYNELQDPVYQGP